MHPKRLGLPTLALLGVLLAGCSDEPSDTETNTSETTTAEAEANATDVEFAQQMIPHHTQAIEMAQMVPDQDVTPELVELAEAIEAAQQPEIDQLTGMLERWGEQVPTTGSDEHNGHDADQMGGMMSADDMQALADSSGDEFERMWLTMMIEHHQGAVTMAETELADGANDEAQALAQEIIDAQETEIAQMEQLLETTGS